MINVLTVLQKDMFLPRIYVPAAMDNMSLQKARVSEDNMVDRAGGKGVYVQFMQIYRRSREVGQSYLTSVGTTLLAMSHALWLMIRIRPQVVLCNGPGTCVPLCIIAFLFKVAGIIGHLFFMPRIARLKKLSLSGLLLFKLCIADQFFVQWPSRVVDLFYYWHGYSLNLVVL
ncbi:UDP-N-acetylglucosamine transferase subunit ALG14-like isoform X2 [Populus nigra]|uniref:UDP-N-acetylglucosamine transferase subunit ALG14-like isoform X2 n=1 Tax=Populus nigra TaxID=3691 RepID=UPI002B279155|nr:UDP-N-acetylglucosamine transferase subunit ALG14-like isoform X2 [Populus nigra]